MPVAPNTSCGVRVTQKRSRQESGDILGRCILGNVKRLRRDPDSTAMLERHAAAVSAVVAAGGVSPMCHAVMRS